jgi:hypothetical protein
MNNRPFGGRNSGTKSHPIDMNNIITASLNKEKEEKMKIE